MGGALAGAVVALLFAPEKGETLRKKIKEKAVEGYNAAKDKVNQQRSKIEDAVKG